MILQKKASTCKLYLFFPQFQQKGFSYDTVICAKLLLFVTDKPRKVPTYLYLVRIKKALYIHLIRYYIKTDQTETQ